MLTVIFKVYDSDGNGKVNFNDILEVLQDLTGSFISDEQREKQSDLLLNADDLDAMWVCLRENCVIDDATGAEKMNYEDFCHIASVCTEQIGPKCRRFFSPSNFMKFEKDESGRIAILPFYLYVMRTIVRNQK
ncbi:putative serine/threonine-protein phosphatase 2A regulatory subunit B'' subunit TON2 [Camellia lanceoleosa]|uniref:Serine/threonine-protein phosphatase 2A regulatory subunit B'' subunit TON2 n=1 Tax=Camellia lanceoleosa TaxID=1840588 RepID=A0ACC0G2W5_9ERIC|nr:putative serine/threonine-protein phosphatase 2A regulatory subunit B'' subunit TON2 [Camellia lanceoleosa]